MSQSGSERDTLKLSLSQQQTEAAKLQTDLNALAELKHQLEQEAASLGAQLDQSKKELVVKTELSAQSAAQIELQNRQLAALREQLKELSASLALATTNIQDKDLKLADLGKQLNLALASKVNELARYRSEFFGKLKEALGNRADLRIVGDRFMVPSDILYDSGSADLNAEAQAQLQKLAAC